MKYVPFRVHSDVTLLMSPSQSKDIVARLTELVLDGCCLTDTNSLSNSVNFLAEMEKSGKKPIIGTILNVSGEKAFIKHESNRETYHLPLIAINTQGWKNLVKIISMSNEDANYDDKPRLSLDQIEDYLDGIVGFGGAFGSGLAQCVTEYGIEGGVRCANILKSLFKEGNFYLEIQIVDKDNDDSFALAEKMREISKITSIPCIATPNSYYCSKIDARDQRILLCTNTGQPLTMGINTEFKRFFISDNFHIPSYEEMVAYGYTTEELENTVKLADRVEKYDILRGPDLKKFDCPGGIEDSEYLLQLCRDGYKKLLSGKINTEQQKVYADRVKYELDVILNAGLSSYFLIVRDILMYCIDRGFLVGPGRGSAAGCLVSYLIGITKVDPIKHDLLFERFYSAGRNSGGNVSLPDIDIDIPTEYREEIIEYVKKKYKEENVAQIITYQTMKGAKALKEVFRAYNDVSFDEINRITKDIVPESKISDELQAMKDRDEEPSIIRWCLEHIPESFGDWVKIEDGEIVGQYADRFKQAIRLEGRKSALSKHAAGVIVAPRRLEDMCPMVLDTKHRKLLVALEMDDAEKIGLMKLDLLGISMLDKVMLTSKLLERKNIRFDGDVSTLDFDNIKTWNLISDGNTKGVFQLESQLGQGMSSKLKPRHIDHLAALTAILRPGSMNSHMEDGKSITEHYIMRKNNVEEVSYLDDALKPMLKNTYGLMIYQEQALKIAQNIAGMTPTDSDKYIRKGVGKKKADLIAQVKKIFLDGCNKEGIVSHETAEMIFSWIESSARYQFNASHSFAYAYNSYLSAYAKANYPIEFFCAYLYYANEKPKPFQEIFELVNNAKGMDIYVFPPNIKLGNKRFDIIDNKIYYGLVDIKGVGDAAVEKLDIEKIKKMDWNEFLLQQSQDINKTAMEALIQSGAMDCFNVSRRKMAFEVHTLSSLTNKEKLWVKLNCNGKNLLESLEAMILSGTGRGAACANKNRHAKIQSIIEYVQKPPSELIDYPHEIAAMEKKLLGVSLTRTNIETAYDRYMANCSCEDFKNGYNNNNGIILAVEINNIRMTKTKKGENPGQEMAFIEVSDETGFLNSVVLFPDSWETNKEHCHISNTVLLIGSRSKDKNSLVISEIYQI